MLVVSRGNKMLVGVWPLPGHFLHQEGKKNFLEIIHGQI